MPYRETEEYGTNYEEPPPDVIEGEEEYEVEKVLASQKTGGANNYNISYDGKAMRKLKTLGKMLQMCMHQI